MFHYSHTLMLSNYVSTNNKVDDDDDDLLVSTNQAFSNNANFIECTAMITYVIQFGSELERSQN